jgi:hypothetical protein
MLKTTVTEADLIGAGLTADQIDTSVRRGRFPKPGPNGWNLQELREHFERVSICKMETFYCHSLDMSKLEQPDRRRVDPRQGELEQARKELEELRGKVKANPADSWLLTHFCSQKTKVEQLERKAG